MLLPYISIIFWFFFRYNYFVNNMHTHLQLPTPKTPPDEDQKVDKRRGLLPIKQQQHTVSYTNLHDIKTTLQFFFLHTSLTTPTVDILALFFLTPPCHSTPNMSRAVEQFKYRGRWPKVQESRAVRPETFSGVRGHAPRKMFELASQHLWGRCPHTLGFV